MSSYITDTSTPASKVIHLDSAHAHVNYQKDEDGNILTTNFLYHMNEAILCPEHLSMICSLHTATIPYSFYNVRHGINNSLVLEYTSGASAAVLYKIVIPSGSYTALTLLNTFLKILAGASDFLRAPWNSGGSTDLYRIYKWNTQWESFVTAGITENPFTTSVGQTPTVVKASLDKARLRYHFHQGTDSGNTLKFKWGHDDSIAGDLFGFRKNAGDVTILVSEDGSTYAQSDKVVDMSDEIHGLYVRTSLTTDGTLNSESGTFSNILGRIAIDVNYGGVIFHTPNNSSHKLQITMPVVKMVGVKLTDDQNRLIDRNGLDWQISIQIDFVPRLQSLHGLTRLERRTKIEDPQKRRKKSAIQV